VAHSRAPLLFQVAHPWRRWCAKVSGTVENGTLINGEKKMVKRSLCHCPQCEGEMVEGLVYGPDETFDNVFSVVTTADVALSRAKRIEKVPLPSLVEKVAE
jgi:hypothetical protein